MSAYWIEAETAVMDQHKIIAYSVWHMSETVGRECVARFSVNRKGAWKAAISLATARLNKLNNDTQ